MSPTLEDMLLENSKYGWPDPHFHKQQYEEAHARAERENAAWAREELTKYPSLKD